MRKYIVLGALAAVLGLAAAAQASDHMGSSDRGGPQVTREASRDGAGEREVRKDRSRENRDRTARKDESGKHHDRSAHNESREKHDVSHENHDESNEQHDRR